MMVTGGLNTKAELRYAGEIFLGARNCIIGEGILKLPWLSSRCHLGHTAGPVAVLIQPFLVLHVSPLGVVEKNG